MDLNQKEHQIIGQFKWISILVIGLGVLVAFFVFYSVYELKLVHDSAFENVVAVEEGSVIILKLQKLVTKMIESSDSDDFSAYKVQYKADEEKLYAYFRQLKATSSFPSESEHLVTLYESWRKVNFDRITFGVKTEVSKTYFQDLEQINTHIGELEELQYKDTDMMFHLMINRIQWSAFLLILVSIVLSIGIQIAVRRIERMNMSHIQFIQESQLLYVKVAEAMPDAMFLIDNETGELLDANQAAESMYGYSISELLHMRNVDLSAEPELTQQAGKSQVNVVPLRYHKSKNGHVFPVEIRASRFIWKGRAVHMAWIHDITERTKMQGDVLDALNEAKAGERAKASFLANMSHEIRTPLNGIYGALQLLEAENLEPETRNLAAISLESSNQLIQMMDQILEYSALEMGTFEFQEIVLSLGQMIEEVSALLAPVAYSKRIDLRIVRLAEAPEWIGDPIRFKQLLIQLVSNAIKFTSEGGVVSIEAIEKQSENQILIRVTDTGCGIKAEDIHRIFRWFEQVDLSQTKAYSGVGLGLATAKGIVSLLGGQLFVESVYGEGSTFTVVLPLEKRQE
jgi:PAS domain S-box-containing protein